MSRRAASEDGAALITVLILATLSIIAVTSAVAYATNSLPRTRAHEDWNAALAAAEAGLEDVKARLAEDDSFYLDPLATDANPAMNGWKELPGGPTAGAYHYRFDTSEVFRTGVLEVVSTGRVGEQERTLRTAMRRRGFLDYIYFTDLEKGDPYSNPSWTDDQRAHYDNACAQYQPVDDGRWWAVATGACHIEFAEGDVIDGPMHTNDAIMMETYTNGKPAFNGRVTTSWEGYGTPRKRYINDGTATPFWQVGDGPEFEDIMPVPETGNSLKVAAEQDGCVYRGPTYIRFFVDGAGDGRMFVANSSTTAPTGTGCLRNTVMDVPSGRVIYVNDDPGVTTHPLGMNRTDGVGTVSSGGGSNETETETSFVRYFEPSAGDAFVHGQLEGQVTVAARNDVVVVHDLTYAGGRDEPDNTDMIGLVADHRVAVYHPVRRVRTRTKSSGNTWNDWGTPTYTDAVSIARDLPPFDRDTSGVPAPGITNTQRVWRDPSVHAAVLALQRSFTVQEHAFGTDTDHLGTLDVYGAIAQRWRGPVGRIGANSGYLKAYEYDTRLRNVSPPHFPVPDNARWAPVSWAEVDPLPTCATPADIGSGCVPA